MSVLNCFQLTGKVALVTGSSSGLGQAIAVGLASAGAQVVGVATRDSHETERLVQEAGGQFFSLQADLAIHDVLAGVVEATVAKFGRLDILVNNAGIIRRANSIDFSEQDWDDVVDLNLKSVFFLSQAAARQFLKQKSGGKIINIASMLSFQGGTRVVSYAASKSGVAGITKSMANEWAQHGIQVNALAPGYMSTDNTAALRADATRHEEILKRIPQGRWGNPDDLVGPAIFLASEASNYLNGAIIPVDGGWLAR